MTDLILLPRFSGRAACAESDPDAWFSTDGGWSAENELARKVCQTQCEVRDECLLWALEHQERYGVWGGLSPRERKMLRRRAA